MTRPPRIGAQAALADLPEWRAAEGRDAIVRRLRFADFDAAFAFMTAVAGEARRLDHHPEWSNVYDRVEIALTTHSAGGVTALDAELARFIDRTAKQAGVRVLSVSGSRAENRFALFLGPLS